MRNYTGAHINGGIPTQINFFCVEQSIGWNWDNYALQDMQASELPTRQNVTRIFPADAGNKGTTNTAKRAAEQVLRWSKPDHEGERPKLVVHKNEPMTGLRIVGSCPGANNTTDYMVKLPGGYVTKMPTDSLMDGMMLGGITDGPELKGEYIFAQADGKLQLVRVGSVFHRAVINAEERRKSAKIEGLKMNPGRMYKDKNGNIGILIGFVNTVSYSPKLTKLQKAALKHRYETVKPFSSLPTMEEVEEFSKLATTTNDWSLASVWYEGFMRAPNETEMANIEAHQKKIAEIISRDLSSSQYNIRVAKTHPYIEEVPGFECETPVDFYASIKRLAQENAQKKEDHLLQEISSYSALVRAERLVTHNLPWEAIDSWKKTNKDLLEAIDRALTKINVQLELCDLSPQANLMIYGMKPIISSHIEKYLGLPQR